MDVLRLVFMMSQKDHPRASSNAQCYPFAISTNGSRTWGLVP
jgi:hypothetical protein